MIKKIINDPLQSSLLAGAITAGIAYYSVKDMPTAKQDPVPFMKVGGVAAGITYGIQYMKVPRGYVNIATGVSLGIGTGIYMVYSSMGGTSFPAGAGKSR